MEAVCWCGSRFLFMGCFLLTFHLFSKLQFRPLRRHQHAHLHCYHPLHRKTDKSNFLFHSTLICFAFLCMIFWLFLHSLWTVASLPISFKDHKPREVSQKRAYLPLATSEDDPETLSRPEDTPRDDSSSIQHNGNGGKPGFISFYNPRNKTGDIVLPPEEAQSTWGRLLWLIGPTVLVSSFTLPPIYLRRIVSAVFEDSLLTGSSLCIPLPLLLNLTQTHFHLLFCRLPHIVLHWSALLLWSRRFSPDNTPFENVIHQNQPFSVRTKNLLCSDISP